MGPPERSSNVALMADMVTCSPHTEEARMDRITSHDWQLLMLAGAIVSLLAWPGTSEAQTVTGQASAVQASVLGTTTTLADSGTLGGTSDARDASGLTGRIPSLLRGEALHATTIGYPDEVDSEAS